MSLPLDYAVMEMLMLVIVGIFGSAICESLSHAGEQHKPKSLTTGIFKGKRKWA